MTHHIIIIGGTSGIGLALARQYVSDGWQVTVVGSSHKKIDKLNQLFYQHDEFNTIQCDIADEAARKKLLMQLEKIAFNRVVYSVGEYYPERQQPLTQQQSQSMLMLNLQAFSEIFMWAGDCLKANNLTDDKYLIAMASVAGLIDTKNNSLYSKCKQAMIATCKAYRHALKPFNINVICIASGYIDTQQLRKMNQDKSRQKPYLISEKQAIQEIQYAIQHNIELHIFPKQMKRVVTLLSYLPKPIRSQIMSLQYRFQDKKK